MSKTLVKSETFNNTPIGNFPLDWDIVAIGDIATYVGSRITPKGGSNVYKKEGILFIRSQNVTFEGLLLDDVAHIDEKIHKIMKRSEVFAHDVLLNITGASIGRCCPFPKGLGTANVNQHVCAIRLPNPNRENAIFLSSVLASYIGESQINKLNAGGNREGLNYQQLRAFLIPFPATQERADIAKILDAIDSAIALTDYGIDIAAAMSVYDQEDVNGAWFDIQEELPKLHQAHHRVINFWQERNLNIYDDKEACVNILNHDEQSRAKFYQLLREFLQAMDAFLPRPQALRYLKDAKKLGELKKLVDDIFRDERPEDAKEKVQALIDQHIQSQGINLKVSPVNILDLDFEQRVQQRRSVQTRAAEMEHAIRYHIRTHLDDDPVSYRNLSDKLEEILQRLGADWNAIAIEFLNLAQKVRAEQTEVSENQSSARIRPFFNALIDTLESSTPKIATQLQTFGGLLCFLLP